MSGTTKASKHDIRNRARNGKLWYDTMHQLLSQGGSVEQIAALAFYDLLTPEDATSAEAKLQGIVPPTPHIIASWARRMPIPIDWPAKGFMDALSSALTDERCREHVEWAGAAARWLMSTSSLDLIANGANLLIMDRDLVNQVIRSVNYPIDDLLLLCVPWPRTFLEFSSPVVIAGEQFRACSFYADEVRNIWCASLYYETQKIKTLTYGRCGHISTGGDDNFRGDNPLKEQTCRVALHNIWDFITSRSVQIETVPRSRKLLPRLPHLQGGQSQVPREVFYLSVDRTVRIPDERGPGKPQEWAYQVEVPGAFHRWIYCASCGDVHRQDLIGDPCRECGKTVGPRANIRMEKYWHAPHVRGPKDAPLKEVVRHMRRGKK